MEEKSGKCIVIGAGDLTLGNIAVGEEDFVIAVDGGLGYCGVLEVEPDLLIGDFDSVSEEEEKAVRLLEQEIPDRVIRLAREKDDTDMLAALKEGLARGYRQFHIYAGTGGRFDHTLANIQCLLYLKKRDAVGYLFSLGEKANGVTISGMKYELENAVLTNDFPIGISNEFIGEEAMISVEEGELVCMISYAQE